ncbi:TetR/AcrR family transcriptional regulator [Bacteroides ovatus]|uniref:TetR/AcrR family transcriptional regulator n=1 Tax=Bacteroides ovatus TaxID=28116 RepID=UPI0022E7DCE1|nr:TetR/AcrR family transcriptional regulator [Bacteroides ovatus]
MRNGKSTKDKLLIEAFKLFTSKPYDRVTFADLEQVTRLSRGAILYHVKTKEKLFLSVVEKFIFEINSISSISKSPQSSLKLVLTHFIESCQKEKNEMADSGISNVNNAMLNIIISAFFSLPEMRKFAFDWISQEKATWVSILEKAKIQKEIRNDIDVELYASLFENIFLGSYLGGIAYTDGYKIDQMEREFMLIYQLIKI